MLLFYTSRISYKLLYHIPVHQRLSAKEVYLEISAGPRISYQKVKGLFSYLKAHKCAVALIFALACEAVGAIEIAGVSYVQTERLYYLAVIFEADSQILVLIL